MIAELYEYINKEIEKCTINMEKANDEVMAAFYEGKITAFENIKVVMDFQYEIKYQ